MTVYSYYNLYWAASLLALIVMLVEMVTFLVSPQEGILHKCMLLSFWMTSGTMSSSQPKRCSSPVEHWPITYSSFDRTCPSPLTTSGVCWEWWWCSSAADLHSPSLWSDIRSWRSKTAGNRNSHVCIYLMKLSEQRSVPNGQNIRLFTVPSLTVSFICRQPSHMYKLE